MNNTQNTPNTQDTQNHKNRFTRKNTIIFIIFAIINTLVLIFMFTVDYAYDNYSELTYINQIVTLQEITQLRHNLPYYLLVYILAGFMSMLLSLGIID